MAANHIRIAPHEAFELHELLTFKNVCATKSATMAALIKDEELGTILRQDFALGQGHIKELKDLLQNSSWAPETTGTSGAANTAGAYGTTGSTDNTNH